MSSTADRASTPARILRVAAGFVAVVLVLAAHWEPPLPIAGLDLDRSYMQSTGMALAQHLRFGVDVLFTFGPLGWFNTSPNVEGLYWAKIFFELAVRGAFVVLFVVLAGRIGKREFDDSRAHGPWSRTRTLPAWGERVLFVACLLAPAMRSDAWWFTAAFALFAWIASDAGSSRSRRVLAALGWTAIGLVKFTFLAFAVLCAAAAIAWTWRKRSRRDAIEFAATCLAVFLVVWSALGQSPLDLPAFLAWSMQLTRGYSEAMALPVPAGHLAWAAVVAIASVAVIVLQLAARPRSTTTRLATLVFAVGSFLAFKAAFVRSFGAVLYFGFAACIPYLMEAACTRGARPSDDEPERPGLVRALAWARTALALLALAANCGVGIGIGSPSELVARVGGRVAENLALMLEPVAMEREVRDQSAARAAIFAMPRTRALVGDAGVDVFAHEHALLASNELTWRPRPFPHAFSVFGERMAERNARFLESADAPSFVLFRSSIVDGRMPTLEDGLALRTILRDFVPRLVERGFVLFERRPDAPRRELPPTTVLRRTLRFGETLDISAIDGRCLVLHLSIRPTGWGRARSFLYQSVPVYAEVGTSDGRTLVQRILPALAGAGAIVAPELDDQDAWISWIRGADVARVVKLRVLAPEPDGSWRDEIDARLDRDDALAPSIPPGLAHEFEYSMFTSAPIRAEAATPPKRALFRGRDEVLLVGAPSRLVFALESGRTHVTANYGFLREALSNGSTDGASFRVLVQESGRAERAVFERFVDPQHSPEDRKLLTLDMIVDAITPGELVLATDPGPAGDPRGDAVFWSAVALARE